MHREPSSSADRAGLPDPLRAVFSVYGEAHRRRMPVAEVAGQRAEAAARTEQRFTRRQLLGATAAVAAAATVPAGLLAPSRAAAASATAPRVVIVGAGLAGLRCADQLWNRAKPVAATVYEADTSHLGGRCWSLRGFFAAGQVSEHGGSFISSTDNAVLSLADSLGLKREYANGGALDAGSYAAWINGALYGGVEQQSDWAGQAFAAFSASYQAIGTPRYDNHTAEAFRLDQLSCLDYLAEIGLPANSQLGQLIQSIQLQSGGEPGQSSALNMISFLGSSSTFDGGSGFDEKYHLVGGNDQLVSGMVGRLPAGTVQQGYQLIALAQNIDGSYTCTFDHCGSTVSVPADHVVLALPFSTLRNVDLSRANLTALKLTAIGQQGMGQNAKLVTQLTKKTWPALGYNGVSNTGPLGYQTAWDGSVSLGAKGAPALLVNFPGGAGARDRLTGAAHGPAPATDVNAFLAQIESVYPGTTAAYNGKAYEDHWSLDPWHLGAYHYYKTGQYTSFAGYEAVQEGRIHFAGEHTDVDNATLDAAVASGVRVAAEITAQL
ncbi:NAD(P)/FAD-dependent oxidoreductase [Kitasatospora sp. MAP5-34]|uniref:flavin monoamine oxidase family protein n=1 Tax=Kitasatospora sp. MAP5-34 TaxID=3035102 RepID=UPI0024767CA8|nr:NAD(P)/FAD-dependent oxidoreductase [Kitasatospora sp. MAP5-34]MDH6577784.1 monoamine oxidase [Kitasatospora sp. MAP5-34]